MTNSQEWGESGVVLFKKLGVERFGSGTTREAKSRVGQERYDSSQEWVESGVVQLKKLGVGQVGNGMTQEARSGVSREWYDSRR